jgi:S-adenosylmethionine:tRNA ribosyltransferase-isomerase
MDRLDIQAFTYNLPDDRIARYPLSNRDASRLLLYSRGSLSHQKFADLAEHLPPNSTLYFNNTRVIPARLLFRKDSGSQIEIFLLNPVQPSTLVAETMTATHSCTWECTIGNLKRWKESQVLHMHYGNGVLEARLIDRFRGLVELRWPGSDTFAEVVAKAGIIPLPPYLNRQAEESDKERYQTVYARFEGAVAAPTAGLHFTDTVLNALQRKGIIMEYLTLHVSAGTFQPIKTEDASQHQMHEEQVCVSLDTIESLLRAKTVVAVGTTSLRTLESLYWYGVRLMRNPESPFEISQEDPYQAAGSLPSRADAFEKIRQHMTTRKVTMLEGYTSIYIVPGYTFRVCDGLITNFHQPGSTLILLIAAFVGPSWKDIYEEALKNNYRFLSYGDSSLLLP